LGEGRVDFDIWITCFGPSWSSMDLNGDGEKMERESTGTEKADEPFIHTVLVHNSGSAWV
jgi:hypothetical protein